MKKPMVIVGILIVLLLAAGIAAYAILAGSPAAGGNAANTTNITQANNTTDVSTKTDHWEISSVGPVSSIGVGEDGTLYAFTGEYGNDVNALNPNGSLKWEFTVPENWRALNVFNDPTSLYGINSYNGINQPQNRWYYIKGADQIGPLFASDDGVLYLYVRENRTTFWNHLVNEDHPLRPANNDWKLEEKLLAISDDKLLWEKTISNGHHIFDYTGLSAKNGRIYVFNDYAVTVFSPNGSELFKIDNASSQAAVDENGIIYVVPALLSQAQPDEYYGDWGFKEPANKVDAYGPDGTLLWEKAIPGQVSRPVFNTWSGFTSVIPTVGRSKFDTLPMYQNGTLYVPLSNGIVALDTDGSQRWIKQYENTHTLLGQGMPIDSYGNVYLYKDELVYIISPDGNEIVRNSDNSPSVFGDASSGTVYDVAWSTPGNLTYKDENGMLRSRNFTLEDMFNANVSAYDVINGKVLWQFTIVPNATYVTVDAGNFKKVVSPYIHEKTIFEQGAFPYGNIQILPGNDAVYVNYQAATYEWPIVLNESRCAYASTLYALDKKNGTVIWQKPLDSLAISMAVNNSTVYYGTNDGKIATTNGTFIGGLVGGGTVKTVGEVAAGGAAVTAFAYVLIKFFGIGAIARAKSRLNKNENRNKVLKYILEHPGSTLHEISQAIGMNVGTVRYHLFILGVNHRIVSHKADGKYVRYFTNSGSYTIDEQYVLSLAKREGIGKLLGLLLEKPGLSNGELSKEMNMRESNVSRYIAELMKKGIVVKNSMPDGRSAFTIKNEYKEHVAFAVRRINGQ